jgi:hypothetical protein
VGASLQIWNSTRTGFWTGLLRKTCAAEFRTMNSSPRIHIRNSRGADVRPCDAAL